MKQFYAKIPAEILDLTAREALQKYTDAACVCEVFRLNRILTAESLNNLSDGALDHVPLLPIPERDLTPNVTLPSSVQSLRLAGRYRAAAL